MSTDEIWIRLVLFGVVGMIVAALAGIEWLFWSCAGEVVGVCVFVIWDVLGGTNAEGEKIRQ